jgi:two-component system OmpR family response regulator
MKNNGRVVTRQMLEDHVWDGKTDPFSKTIEAHIHKLRQKIDLPGHKKLIRTVAGRGYKFQTDEPTNLT